MSTDPFHRAVYLTGPTAVGKTAVGVELARWVGAEVIALDSMTLYRGMDIGTAKPSLAERQRIPHHLIDVLDPWESASVAWWLKQAQAACWDIEARGKRVLFVGGTALYLKALLKGLFEGPAAAARTRGTSGTRLQGSVRFSRRRAVDAADGRDHQNANTELCQAAVDLVSQHVGMSSMVPIQPGRPTSAGIDVYKPRLGNSL